MKTSLSAGAGRSVRPVRKDENASKGKALRQGAGGVSGPAPRVRLRAVLSGITSLRAQHASSVFYKEQFSGRSESDPE